MEMTEDSESIKDGMISRIDAKKLKEFIPLEIVEEPCPVMKSTKSIFSDMKAEKSGSFNVAYKHKASEVKEEPSAFKPRFQIEG